MVDDSQLSTVKKEEQVSSSLPVPSSNLDMTTSLLEKAEILAKRIEEANKKSEELLARNQELAARDILGGRSVAGIIQRESTDEEKKKEGMKNYFKGTAIEKMIR